MKDRVPVNPGRVLITPESGTPYYATMTRADNPTQEGDPLNKNTLLKDATAALFGLGNAAVPDDVLGVLSRLHSGLGNEYVWEKSKSQDSVVAGASNTWGVTTPMDSAWVQISSTVEVVNGTIVLVNPVTYKYLSANVSTILAALAGNYFIHSHMSTTTVYKDGGCYKSGTGIMWVYCPLSISTEVTVYGYVNSPDPNAYPVDDGYTYTARGMLGEKVRLVKGSYKGTGAAGPNNPNSLSFDFAPKLVIMLFYIRSNGAKAILFGSSSSTSMTTVMPTDLLTTDYAANTGFLYYSNAHYGKKSQDGKTIYWYNGDAANNSAEYQFNASNTTYYYMAIG